MYRDKDVLYPFFYFKNMKYAALIFALTVCLTFKGYAQFTANGTLFQGGIVPMSANTTDTKGSRYLFSHWVSGFVVSPQDSVYKNPAYTFNYDKVDGILLLSQDKQQAIAVDKSRIKRFTLNSTPDSAITFESVPAIDKTNYVELVADGKKYKVYKSLTTIFTKANYHSDGMSSTGNNYDEYADKYAYYVLNTQTSQVQPLALKKKAIKSVFASEGKKVDDFFSANDGDINDDFLKNLVISLDK